MIKTVDIVWLERNYTLLRRYIFSLFPDSYEQRLYMEEFLLLYENAYSTRTLLIDFQRSNIEKLKFFYDSFEIESLISICVAGRGSGKTAFGVSSLIEFKKRGFKIFALFPFPKLNFIDEIVFDPSQVPPDSLGKTILFIDEIGKKYKARDSNSEESKAVTDELIGLRHLGISILGGVQDLSLADINIIRLADILIWKNYNLENIELSRSSLITPMVSRLMPSELSKVLINFRGSYSTFSFPLYDDSKKISTYLKDLKKKKKEVIDYLSQYYTGAELLKILYTQYSMRLSFTEQEEFNLCKRK